MLALATMPPRRRSDLIIKPVDQVGRSVVKDRITGQYFELGEQESFLLTRLDGRRSSLSVRIEFERRFRTPLSEDEFDEFLDLASDNGFLKRRRANTGDGDAPTLAPPSTEPRTKQNILYWRKSVLDPDRFLNWLAPRLRFCWTRTFLFVSILVIALAAAVVWANRAELSSYFPYVFRWQTWVLVWLMLTFVTTCHEFSHGLTCKHHGGEVHEIGFLLMFFIPCFYCNVSDAWLIREKSKRLGVTFAGAYCDLLVWSLAVIIWRVSAPDSLLNYLAWVVLSVSGVRLFFNLNPLLKLDGYYLLSDWLSISNLRQRSWESVAARLRWLLWGADRPMREPRAGLLLSFGIATWAYGFFLLGWMFLTMTRYTNARWGTAAALAVVALGIAVLKGQFSGISQGEVTTMLKTRQWRSAAWIVGLCCGAAVLSIIPITRKASGAFQLRSPVRVEVRAPVAGFVRTVAVDEGDHIDGGNVVAQLEVVDLSKHIAQKRAEVDEASAKLRLLEVGARPEQILEEHRHVQRAQGWYELAAQDLQTARKALAQELQQIDELIRQSKIELEYAKLGFDRAQAMFKTSAMSQQEYSDWEKKVQVSQAVLDQHLAQRKVRETLGTTEAESELARREKELADARMNLALLEAGTRHEEIEAQRAQLARVREELSYLCAVQGMLQLHVPTGGVVVTPHLREKVGQYLKEGELLCVVEQSSSELQAEISLPEEESAQVRPGQVVELKAMATPYKTFRGRVQRVAPVATTGPVRSTVMVYCQLEAASVDLRPGMSGHARICCGRWSLGRALSEQGLRLIRTEFWW
jgi:multidrug efflux pump subunit AcrA (membrane-fusion protein)